MVWKRSLFDEPRISSAGVRRAKVFARWAEDKTILTIYPRPFLPQVSRGVGVFRFRGTVAAKRTVDGFLASADITTTTS